MSVEMVALPLVWTLVHNLTPVGMLGGLTWGGEPGVTWETRNGGRSNLEC